MEMTAAQSIVSKLGQLLVDELREIRGVGDKVVHLTDELATMNAVLRMVSEADESAVDRLVREWEKQVRELAYDAEDCADIYWLRIGRPIPLLPGILKWAKYHLERLRLQRTLAADVKALLARAIAVRAIAVSERRARYRIDPAALPRSPWFAPVSVASASAGALRRADDPDQFVGIKEQTDALAERIQAIHAEDDRRLKVFSIVGFGGLGKTTLAVELCRQLESAFQPQALVSVSQAFDAGKDMKGLLARLLPQIVKVKRHDDTHMPEGEEEARDTNHANEEELKIEHMDVEHLSTKLKDFLKEKRYLIVIDDVWSLQAWEAIRIRLPENNCGSRIIVTTRIETVAEASSVSEECVHHMKPLEPKTSEELFIKRVFGSLGICPDGLEDIMRKILKKCGGLPLAIVRIASILASYNSVESLEMWMRVSNSIGSQMENHPTLEGMRQLITLSYGYLPHHLKACMMYLSIFPEDYVIAKDRLLYRWIAEGLVAEKRGLTLFDVAEEYLNELISMNMIQTDKLSMFISHYWGYNVEMVVACRVHDMMLEVMVSLSQEANFVSLVGRQYGAGLARGTVRRLTVHGNEEEELKHTAAGPKKKKKERVSHGGIEMMKLQHLRSLSTFQVEGLDKLLDRLGDFRLLRVLDLEGCKALRDKHMRHVCRLYLLRFLGLRGTSITMMPRKIGDLGCLESLDVEQTKIDNIPPIVTKMSKLERMMAPKWILPRGIGNMKALRKVSVARLKDDVQVAREIGELQQLQTLFLVLLGNPKEVKEEFPHALASSLSKTYALRALHLSAVEDAFHYSQTVHMMNFLLDVSSPPPLLQCLTLSGRISRLPDWISSLKHLTTLSMSQTNLDSDQLLDPLCELPNLQILQLACILHRDGALVAHTKHKFPALRILDLVCQQFPLRFIFDEGSMTKLEKLVWSPWYQHVQTSIFGIGNLKKLKEVKLVNGTKDHPLLKRALQQLKEENENRDKSNQIKVLVEYK